MAIKYHRAKPQEGVEFEHLVDKECLALLAIW